MTILTPLQNTFLKAFFTSYLGKMFFLSGGTALAAFYLHHRLSEDLDLFTLDQNLKFDAVNAELNKIAKTLNLTTEHHISSPTFIRYIFKHQHEILKVDLVKDIPVHFGKVRKMQGVIVDSLENIAVGKLLAIFGRTDGKDFIDLYFLLRGKEIIFNSIFNMAKKKDLGLNEFYLAGMLAQVKEFKDFPKTIKPFDRKALTDLLLRLSDELFKKIKPKVNPE